MDGCSGASRPAYVVIRRASPPDAEMLTDLHLDVWDEAYAHLMPATLLAERRAGRTERIAAWRQILAGTFGTTWVATTADAPDRLLGFVSVSEGRDEPAKALPPLEVMALYVRAEVYGAGLGWTLLTTATGDSPAYLWVLDGNERAITFYQRQGFEFDGQSRVEREGTERRMVRRTR